jgi:ABC-type multidrug transport system fused ATPase/permease subunit
LSGRRRTQLFGLLLLMLLGAAAEVVSLGSVMPFITALADPSALSRYPRVTALLSTFASPDQLPLALTFAFVAISIGAAAVRIALGWAMYKFAFGVGHDISVSVYERTLAQPLAFHAEHNSSDLLSSIEKCNAAVFGGLLPVLHGAVAVVVTLSIMAGLLYIDAAVASIAAVSFTVIYVSATLFTRERLARDARSLSTTQAKRVQTVQEGTGGIRDILIDSLQHIFVRKFRMLDLELRRAQASSSIVSTIPRYVVEAASMLLLALLAYWLAERSGGITAALPILGALALGAQKLLPQLQVLYYGHTTLRANAEVIADVVQYLDLPVPDQGERTGALRFDSDIKLANVSFRYRRGSAPVLQDTNLTIRKGSSVGVVGPTGGGKSTLIDIVMGLLAPTSGSLEIDGVPITEETRKAWQARIAHVPQQIFIADTTIAENIAFGLDPASIDMERVQSAAKAARVHDFVMDLPEGYRARAGERGVRLSGGQRQRLGIARALYKCADVLILDEATSALDSAIEQEVIEALQQIGYRVTLIMVAHRLSTLSGCELLLEVKDGKVTLHTSLTTLGQATGLPA